jgi:hypothetical protein
MAALAVLGCTAVACTAVGCEEVAAPDDAAMADAETADGGPAGPCATFEQGVEAGRVANPALDELSGLGASRRNPGVLYANNDSGDGARVFVLTETGGDLGTITLSGAGHVDYEDLAVGPGPDGESWIYVADTGDNAARDLSGPPRTSIVVYRFPEPTVDPAGGPVALAATPEALTLTYPGTPHDCEAVAVDPESGDLYLLTKEDTGPSTLFVVRAPLPTDAVLEEVTTLDVGGELAPGSRNATAMDFAPSGRALLLRTYNRLYLFARGADQSWAEALAMAGVAVPVRTEPQGEAVAWRPDGRAYFTSSEGGGPPLFVYSAADPACVSF